METLAKLLANNSGSASRVMVLKNQYRFPEYQVYCSEPEATLALSVKNGIGEGHKSRRMRQLAGHAVKLALKQAYGLEYVRKGWRAFVEKVRRQLVQWGCIRELYRVLR